MGPGKIFSQEFLITLRALVGVHHSIYPSNPPQGIFFERLVEESFKKVRQPYSRVARTAPNVPGHDLVIGDSRISLKTETGRGTGRDYVQITKLCTTERDPWTPEALVQRVMDHLSRYDEMLMLRAVWDLPVIHYQLLDVPVALLRLIGTTTPTPVGRRTGRGSLGADVCRGPQKVFHVHFDGSDGKCQIRDLPVSECRLLLSWDLQISD